jgi:hypothetical protein
MATEHDGRSHNQPSHEAQVKGGQHSHQGAQHGSGDSATAQHDQGSGSRKSDEQDGRSHNQPSHEAQVKGGQHSHSGSQK